jgi:hypothetical protein
MSNNQNQNIFDQFETAKKQSGKYVKMLPGERRTFQVNLSKTRIVDSVFEGKATGGKSVEFCVIDPMEPQVERILAMGVRKAEGVMALLRSNKTLIDIQKIGNGKDSSFVAFAL